MSAHEAKPSVYEELSAIIVEEKITDLEKELLRTKLEKHAAHLAMVDFRDQVAELKDEVEEWKLCAGAEAELADEYHSEADLYKHEMNAANERFDREASLRSHFEDRVAEVEKERDELARRWTLDVVRMEARVAVLEDALKRIASQDQRGSTWFTGIAREALDEEAGSCADCTAKPTPEDYIPCPDCGAECGHRYCKSCEGKAWEPNVYREGSLIHFRHIEVYPYTKCGKYAGDMKPDYHDPDNAGIWCTDCLNKVFLW